MPYKKYSNKKLKIKIMSAFGGFAALAVAIGIGAYAIQKPTADPRSFASENVLNRVGIRKDAAGKKEFFDTVTGKSVLFRGNNYLRYDTSNGRRIINNFKVGQYDRARHAAALAQMHEEGYNAIRVPFVYADIAKKTGTGVDEAYVDNIIDFLKLAKQNGIYVFGVLGYLPFTGGYYPTDIDPNFEDDKYNRLFLQKEMLDGKKRLMRDFFTVLKQKNAPLEVVSLWVVENEPYYKKNKKPFTLTSGKVTTTNGKTYDMASETDKMRMADENIVYYLNEARAAIKEVDPQAVVGVSMGTPAIYAHFKQHDVINRPKDIFNKSTIDFVDVHIYPGFVDYQTEMASLNIGTSDKLLVLAEFGAYPKNFEYNIELGAKGVKDLQIKSCKDGFKGWYYYDWDSTELEPDFRIYHTTEGNQAINKALAPKYRPDPCSATGDNSSGALVTASCGAPVYPDACAPAGVYKLRVKDVVSSSKVMFATWNQSNKLDDQKNYMAKNIGSGVWEVQIDRSNHPGAEKMQSNIWTFDASGKQVWCTGIVMPVCN